MKTVAISAFICFLVLSPALNAGQPSADDADALVSDIDTLCSRMEMKRISAWSQPVYRTDAWSKLMMRADAGDAKAFCEIARLMKRYRSRLSCQPLLIDEIQGRCNNY